MKKTPKEILYETKDKYNIGNAWQLTEHIILEAMDTYAKQETKNTLNFDEIEKKLDDEIGVNKRQTLDLSLLEQKLDEALGKETRETLEEWLNQQRK